MYNNVKCQNLAIVICECAEELCFFWHFFPVSKRVADYDMDFSSV